MTDEYPRVAWLRYEVTSNENYRLEDSVRYDGKLGDFDVWVTRREAQFTPTRYFATEQHARAALDPLLRAWELNAAMTHAAGVIDFRFRHCRIRDKPLDPGQLEGLVLMTFAGNLRAHVTLDHVPEPPRDFAIDNLVAALGAFYMQSRKTPMVLLHMAYAMTTCLGHHLGDLSEVARSLRITRPVFEKINRLASTRGEGAQVRKFAGHAAPTPLTDVEREWMQGMLKIVVERAGAAAAGVTDLPEINMGTHPLPDA